MFRVLFSTSRLIFNTNLIKNVVNVQNVLTTNVGNEVRRNFSLLQPHNLTTPKLLEHPKVLEIANNIQNRGLIKYSIRKGTRKSVKCIARRFRRLDWGIWIRTKCGRHKKLWKKSPPRKRRLRQHVFCNATQSRLLDKMVGPYWRKPKYWVDDPYSPYNVREEFMYTARKPKPFIPPEA